VKRVLVLILLFAAVSSIADARTGVDPTVPPIAGGSAGPGGVGAGIVRPGEPAPRPQHRPVGTWVRTNAGDCTAGGAMFIPNVSSGSIEGSIWLWELVAPDGTVVGDYVENECIPGSRAPSPPPSAAAVFSRADIPRPEVATNPSATGLVGVDNWFWHEGPTEVPVRVTLDGWTAAATARIVGYEWALGNGDVVTSDVPGTEKAPAATYTYIRHGRYRLTESTIWAAAFVLTGWGVTTTSSLGTFRVTGPPREYEVREIQAVVHR
jgi:hypothetical protein